MLFIYEASPLAFSGGAAPDPDPFQALHDLIPFGAFLLSGVAMMYFLAQLREAPLKVWLARCILALAIGALIWGLSPELGAAANVARRGLRLISVVLYVGVASISALAAFALEWALRTLIKR